MSDGFTANDLFVSLQGKDTWTGRLPEPNAAGSDGPLATLNTARRLLRERKRKGLLGEPVTVWIRGGRYLLERPIVFTPDDSGPVLYSAYPGEQPVFDGGVRITGWVKETVNGCACWAADVREALQRPHSGFRQLFVNGSRRPRARFPKKDYYWIEAVPGQTPDTPFDVGSNVFQAAPGDFQVWRNLEDVDVVALHYWSEQRLPVQSYDPATRLVTCRRKSSYALNDDIGARFAKYTVENVFEALGEPGEWYLDRPQGRLYYVPRPGETPETADVVLTHLLQMIRIEGQPDDGRFVEFLRFRGLAFEYSDWIQPRGWGVRFNPYVSPERQTRVDSSSMLQAEPDRTVDLGSGGQGAQNVPGVLFLQGARYCAIEDCRLEHLGWYGIELADGCAGIRLVGNTIADTGGGGIKADGSRLPERWRARTTDSVITDNHIHHGGEVFFSSTGILLQHTAGNLVAHNHIHDYYYTGISCGWVWGYGPNVSHDNRIEKNHIHHLGKRVLSDMGGIYILGVQPGTVIRGNVVHDVERANYGGWGIYPDEGSSHLVIEDNLCYNTSSQTFHQHYGRENTVRNNIWAFGHEGLVALSRGNAMNRGYTHPGRNILCPMTFEHNIFITDGEPVYVGALADSGGNLDQRELRSDLNLFFDVSGREIVSGNGVHGKHGRENLTRAFDLPAWQRLGFDRHSLVADPGCRNLRERDFTLAPDSPALALGFRPFDISDVGPRPRDRRQDEPECQRPLLDW